MSKRWTFLLASLLTMTVIACASETDDDDDVDADEAALSSDDGTGQKPKDAGAPKDSGTKDAGKAPAKK